MTRIRTIVLVSSLAVATGLAACSSDSSDGTSTSDGATTSEPSTPATGDDGTTTSAAPTGATTTTSAPAVDPPTLAAEHGLDLPEGALVVAGEVLDDGGVRVGAVVEQTPPPNYAGLLDPADWEIISVTFGSERTTAYNDREDRCRIAYADYRNSNDPEYWVWLEEHTDLTRDECVGFAEGIIEHLGGLGDPSLGFSGG